MFLQLTLHCLHLTRVRSSVFRDLFRCWLLSKMWYIGPDWDILRPHSLVCPVSDVSTLLSSPRERWDQITAPAPPLTSHLSQSTSQPASQHNAILIIPFLLAFTVQWSSHRTCNVIFALQCWNFNNLTWHNRETYPGYYSPLFSVFPVLAPRKFSPVIYEPPSARLQDWIAPFSGSFVVWAWAPL